MFEKAFFSSERVGISKMDGISNDDTDITDSTTSSKEKHVAPEIIVGVSKLLSIDPIKEPQYLWIAEECAKAELPSKEWRELTNEDGETM